MTDDELRAERDKCLLQAAKYTRWSIILVIISVVMTVLNIALIILP